MRTRILYFMLLLSGSAFSQPYLDVLTVQGSRFPTSPLYSGKADEKIKNDWWLVNLNAPFILNKKNLLLLSPGWEQHTYKFAESNTSKSYETVYVPLTFLHTFSDTSMNISATGIYRFNKVHNLPFDNTTDMAGGAVLFSKVASPTFTWKAGAYYNKEFFGDFFLPLAGFEWKASKKWYIWGLLPNTLVADYRLLPSLHTGLNVNCVVESYKESQPGGYTKFTEEQLNLFADYYLPHMPVIVSFQVGHTVGRKFSYRANEQSDVRVYTPSESMIFHLGIAYRFVTSSTFVTPQSKGSL